MTIPKRERGKAVLGQRQKEALWRDMIDQAKAGDIDYVKMVADRLFPKAKPQAQTIRFDLVGDTPTAKANSILTAISNGQLDPDTGIQLLTALNHTMKIVDIDDISKRLDELEAARNGK